MAASGFNALHRTAAAAMGAFALMCATPAHAQSVIRDAEIEDTLRVYTTPLLNAAGVAPEDVHIYLIDDSSINAFVAGGQGGHRCWHGAILACRFSPRRLRVRCPENQQRRGFRPSYRGAAGDRKVPDF